MNLEALHQKINSLLWIRIQHLPRFFVERWQLRELKWILKEASHVPVYRKIWKEHGVSPEDIRTLADLKELPITSKQLFRRYPVREWLHDALPPGSYGWKETSGSTGEPFRVPVGRGYYFRKWHGVVHLSMKDARTYRFLLWRGFSPKEAWRRYGKIAEIKIAAQPWGREYLHIPTSDLRNAPQDVIRRLCEFGPGILNSRPTLLVELARLLSRVPEYERPRIDFLISHGEILTPSQREYVEDTFGCPLHEFYGFIEVGDLAMDCEVHYGLHIHEESFIIEILDEHNVPLPPGEWGRIVVTHFCNPIMPFIRYDTGDSGMILPALCPCGLRARRLLVRGRTGGFFTLGGKRYNYAEFQMVLSHHNPIILRYQLAKVAHDKIELRIIPAMHYSAARAESLKSEFRGRFGFEPEIRIVNEIPYTDGGKTNFIIDETPLRQ